MMGLPIYFYIPTPLTPTVSHPSNRRQAVLSGSDGEGLLRRLSVLLREGDVSLPMLTAEASRHIKAALALAPSAAAAAAAAGAAGGAGAAAAGVGGLSSSSASSASSSSAPAWEAGVAEAVRACVQAESAVLGLLQRRVLKVGQFMGIYM